MENAAEALAANPYIIDLHRLGRLAFIFLMAFLLIMLVLKIILDFRKYHYK